MLRPGGADLTIAGGVREFGRATPDAIAVRDGDRALTYAALDERSSRVACALLSLGLTTGDRVALLSGNRLEYPEIAAGIAKAGLVLVPVNPRLTAPEVEFILGHSGARVLITDGSADFAVRVIRIGPEYEKFLDDARAVDPWIPVDERDPFCIAYTAGTTGDPKGVLISHRSRSLTFYATALEWGIGPGRRTVAVAPMYHGAGFAFAYAAVHCGATVSMLRSFQPDALIDLLARDGAQSVFLVPTHAQLIRQHFSEIPDLPLLDTLYFNAAALPKVLKEWVFEAFPGVGVHELYGSTEAGVVTNLRPPDARRKAGTVGHPWFGTQVRIVDSAGREVGPGEPGELYSRSPYLMNGYHENPAATAACTTDDGFLTSGDIVVRDEEGFISIVDRVKDVIITGGVNVYPRDVEEVLLAHPSVTECAVVGEPDDRWGERVVAYLVSPGPVVPDVLEAYLRDRLAGFKIPKQYRAVPALPRNAAGKILKRELRSTQ
ncbi:AMP-binding protein [Actinoplanes sp. NBC_00393]|uniref:class I adenylate-forming enzyme family protein n=1 Tax=Actinoplanes sp. NBC_00393 TaxID=2975953 RepID=UPI002E21123D